MMSTAKSDMDAGLHDEPPACCFPLRRGVGEFEVVVEEESGD